MSIPSPYSDAWRIVYLLSLCPEKSGIGVSLHSVSLNLRAIFSLDRSFILWSRNLERANDYDKAGGNSRERAITVVFSYYKLNLIDK